MYLIKPLVIYYQLYIIFGQWFRQHPKQYLVYYLLRTKFALHHFSIVTLHRGVQLKVGWRYLLKVRYTYNYSNQVWHSVTPIKSEAYTLATRGVLLPHPYLYFIINSCIKCFSLFGWLSNNSYPSTLLSSVSPSSELSSYRIVVRIFCQRPKIKQAKWKLII